MTQRKILRQAFITVVGAVALGAGCDNTVTTTSEEACTFGDPGCEASCPSAKPASGSACSQSGQQCWYSTEDCEDFVATCAGVWAVDKQVSSCNPPPPVPECPEALPVHGTDCAGWEPYQCHGYIDPLCGIDVSATCNGTWEVDQVSCNPPPPELCWDAVDETACGAVGFCDWLVPACEGNTLPAAGCYPADGCNLCWGDCIDVNVHPCPDGNCNSCSVGQQICVAPTD